MAQKIRNLILQDPDEEHGKKQLQISYKSFISIFHIYERLGFLYAAKFIHESIVISRCSGVSKNIYVYASSDIPHGQLMKND